MNSEVKRLRFGAYVKEQRNRRNLTQEKLAELTDLSPVTISAIERGDKAPSFDSLCVIIQALNLDAHRIFPYDVHSIQSQEDAYRYFCEMGKGLSEEQLLALTDFIYKLKKLLP
ncbi:MAG: helix-turn-helix transcriptional regulator [Erysipelotrichaceae bacterium]|nr:helix-turn-helix transcriptional regulator [Erysipelotrichaceae bacterium]MCI9312985.1 helix-turn-helix transcriptional regulator [Erysipelotrichaceae bacterium]